MKIRAKLTKKLAIYGAVILLIVALDQFTKYLAVKFLSPIGSVPLIKNVFHFTYVKNPGAAFGIFSDKPWIFQIFSVVGILVLFVYLLFDTSLFDEKDENGVYPPLPFCVGLCLAFIIGGGIGNMIDRLLLGYVVDFFDFTLINFAVFNVADSFVTVGAFWLIILLAIPIFTVNKQKKEPPAP